MENYYKLFEVNNDADISELRSAFRKKAKLCHPDLFLHVSPEERKNLQKNLYNGSPLTSGCSIMAKLSKKRYTS